MVRRPHVHAGSWRGDVGTGVTVTELRDPMEGVEQKSGKNKRKKCRDETFVILDFSLCAHVLIYRTSEMCFPKR